MRIKNIVHLLFLSFSLPLISVGVDFLVPHKKFLDPKVLEQKDLLNPKVISIDIPDFPGAYNPALIEHLEGYLLFFRYDVPLEHIYKKTKFHYMTYIGFVYLDCDFKVDSEVKFLNLNNPYCEDPRVFRFDDKIVVFFNTIESLDPTSRTMKMAFIDPDTGEVEYVCKLPGKRKNLEKNWTPFVRNEGGKSSLYFVYDYHTLEVVELNKIDAVWQISSTKTNPLLGPDYLEWKERWGPYRGGAPLIEIDDEIFCFTHSCFEETVNIWGIDRRNYYYHAGLFTLSSDLSTPLKLLPNPILYEGAYDSPRKRSPNKWVIYPTGAVYKPQSGKIYLSLGENDGKIRILEFDKNRLISQLTPFQK
jgi:hypothetical protein